MASGVAEAPLVGEVQAFICSQEWGKSPWRKGEEGKQRVLFCPIWGLQDTRTLQWWGHEGALDSGVHSGVRGLWAP